MAQDFILYGIIVGISAVGLALFDRGYGAYLTAKKDNPDLKFSGDYIVNLVVAAGGAGGLFAGVFPAIVNAIAEPKAGMDVVWFGLQFISAYLSTLGILDKLNRITEGKTEAGVFKKLAVNKGTVTVDENKGSSGF